MGLVSDGGVHSGWAHIEALIELAAREGVPDLSSTPSPTAATRCPTPRPATSRSSRAGWTDSGRVGHRVAVATTRWTATAAGTGSSSPTTRSSTRTGERADTAPGARRGRLRRGEDRRVHRAPTVIGDYDGMADGDVAIHFNFRPDRARQLCRALGEEDFDEFDRGDAPRGRADHAHRVPGGVALPGRLPAAQARDHPGRGARGAWGAPAPRRRDREVRARHLLLQRRARGRVGGGGALPGRLAARRPHLRPQARDERRRGRRGVREPLAGRRLPLRDHQLRQPRHGRPHGRHPGGGQGRRGGRLLPRRGRRGGPRARAAPASSPPTTATPTTCSSPTARRTPRTRPTRCRSS